jgi:hypothetical protein
MDLAVQTLSNEWFDRYRFAILGCGILLVVLGVWVRRAGPTARVITGAIGVVYIGYAGYLFFLLSNGHLYQVYTFIFILPFLAVGFVLYSVVHNWETDYSVRKQLEQERADRRAARAAQTVELSAVEPAEPGSPEQAPPA